MSHSAPDSSSQPHMLNLPTFHVPRCRAPCPISTVGMLFERSAPQLWCNRRYGATAFVPRLLVQSFQLLRYLTSPRTIRYLPTQPTKDSRVIFGPISAGQAVLRQKSTGRNSRPSCGPNDTAGWCNSACAAGRQFATPPTALNKVTIVY